MNTVAITAVDNILVGHYFDSEAEALKKFPFIRSWGRHTFDPRKIRYHSKQAEKYWRSRQLSDPITSTAIYYKNGVPVRYEYN